MDKRLKGLEALKQLKDRAVHDEYLYRQDTNREKAISFLNEIDNFVNAIEKELKALEIIKEKQVNVLILKYSFISEEGVEYYNKYFGNEDLHLTQEEYELLKEVLL